MHYGVNSKQQHAILFIVMQFGSVFLKHSFVNAVCFNVRQFILLAGGIAS